MTHPADTISMLPSTGAPDLERAVAATLQLLQPRLDALRASRPQLRVVLVAERRVEAQNPAT